MRHPLSLALAALLAAGAFTALAAQQPRVHLNPVVAKLAAGRTVYGLINAGDLSIVNARETARAPVDFVYADMEHNPLDFAGLAMFLLGLTDKAAILSKGNLQPNVALFARFPPEADQSNWVVKQALDIGLMGVIFNGVDTTGAGGGGDPVDAVSAAEGRDAARARRHSRLRHGGGDLGLGRERRRVRTARGRVAAQSRRRPAGGADDRIGRRA